MRQSRSKKIVIILFVFLFILLIATFFVYSGYLKNSQKDALKSEFFTSIQNNDLGFFLSNDLNSEMFAKTDNSSYKSVSNVKVSTTMKNSIFSELDLSKFQFNFELDKNNENKRYFSRFKTMYASNHFLTLDCISGNDQFAVKSDEIVNRYVGLNKKNAQTVADKLTETEVDFVPVKTLKNFLLDRENIDFGKLSKAKPIMELVNVIKENTSASNFSKKDNIVITLDSQQLTTTEYTLQIDSKQLNNILNSVSESIQNNDMISELVVSNVKEFDTEKGILEYTDNENPTEIQGERNNFYTSFEIWGENTASQNTVSNEMVDNTVQNTTTNETNTTVENTTVPSTNETVDNSTVENTTVSENTVTNEVETDNTVENNTVTYNTNTTVIENTVVSENEVPSETVQNEVIQIPVQPNEIVSPTEPQNTEPIIEEDDNLRLQGFIEVNEDTNYEIAENEFFSSENYQEAIKNVQKMINKIDWNTYILTGAKANSSQEEIIQEFQKILRDRQKQENSLIVKMYVSDDKVVKINFEIPENLESFDIEIISKSDNEKSLNLTYLVGSENEADGYNINVYKKEEDVSSKIKLYLGKISKNKIIEKTVANLQTKGIQNSKKYSTDLDVTYSNNDGEFKVESQNSLNFDVTPQIEDLNTDNCLFLDNISDEEFVNTRDAIKQKTREVLSQKNRNLNIIDINTSNSVVQQNQQQQVPVQDENAKAQVKQVLIQTIANKMREYLDNGQNLTIQDLEGLEIPGYQVSISISSNLAIITVNGYGFKLDSDFNLSDS